MEKKERPILLKEKLDEKLFSLLVASVKEYAIFLTDPEGYILTWNEGAARIKGYRSEDIVGRHLSIFYTPEDIAANEPRFNLEQALKNGTHESEGWRIRKNGSRFWANIVFTAIYQEGRHIGFAKVTRDETEKKIVADQKASLQAELEQRVQEQTHALLSTQIRFRKLIEHSYDGIALLDKNLRVFYRSLSAERINGWSDTEILDSTLEDFTHPDDRQDVTRHLAEVGRRPGVPLLLNFRSSHRGGHYIWLECLFTNMLEEEDIRAIVCNFRDISKALAGEREILRQNAVMREVSWLSSHELRRPAASILGLFNLMEIATPEEKEEALVLAKRCANELDDMIRLIHEKLDQSDVSL